MNKDAYALPPQILLCTSTQIGCTNLKVAIGFSDPQIPQWWTTEGISSWPRCGIVETPVYLVFLFATLWDSMKPQSCLQSTSPWRHLLLQSTSESLGFAFLSGPPGEWHFMTLQSVLQMWASTPNTKEEYGRGDPSFGFSFSSVTWGWEMFFNPKICNNWVMIVLLSIVLITRISSQHCWRWLQEA